MTRKSQVVRELLPRLASTSRREGKVQLSRGLCPQLLTMAVREVQSSLRDSAGTREQEAQQLDYEPPVPRKHTGTCSSHHPFLVA